VSLGWRYHKQDRILCMLPLAPGNVWEGRESETAGGDVYCTEDDVTTGQRNGRRLCDERDERVNKRRS